MKSTYIYKYKYTTLLFQPLQYTKLIYIRIFLHEQWVFPVLSMTPLYIYRYMYVYMQPAAHFRSTQKNLTYIHILITASLMLHAIPIHIHLYTFEETRGLPCFSWVTHLAIYIYVNIHTRATSQTLHSYIYIYIQCYKLS